MKRAVCRRRRGVFVLGATLLAVAGIAWGAAVRPHAAATNATPVASVTPAPVAVTSPAPTPVAAVPVAPSHHSSMKHTAPAQVAATSHAGEAGMRIFRDPETGEIGPPTSENAAMIAREAEPEVDNRNLPVVALPNGGGYELLIDGKIEDAVIMQIDSKGNRVMSCTQDPKSAHQHPVVAPQREDR